MSKIHILAPTTEPSNLMATSKHNDIPYPTTKRPVAPRLPWIPTTNKMEALPNGQETRDGGGFPRHLGHWQYITPAKIGGAVHETYTRHNHPYQLHASPISTYLQSFLSHRPSVSFIIPSCINWAAGRNVRWQQCDD